jgi:mercuric ion transport protein
MRMSAEIEPRADPPDRRTDASAALLSVGGLLAAFGATACCGLPIVLATLGLGTAWLGAIALFTAPHQTTLVAAAALLLLAGVVVFAWQRSRRPGASGARCVRPVAPITTAFGLLLGFALLTLGILYV